jgi:RNA-directed DNA polymerase
MVWFPGDDLLAACRPRGLPIGNLTSQFWSNCYLHPFDQFVKRELRCRAYLRYVDDFALFSDSKRDAVGVEASDRRTSGALRLTIHERPAQVLPVDAASPGSALSSFPTLPAGQGAQGARATSHLGERLDDYRAGRISFAEFDASVKGWVNHIRYADSWGLRKEVFRGLRFTMRPRSPKAVPEWAAIGDGGMTGAACEPGRPLRVARKP